MSEALRFTIEAPPVPAGRPRAFTRGKFASIYMPKATRDYEDVVAAFAHQAATAQRWTKPDKRVALGLVIRIWR